MKLTTSRLDRPNSLPTMRSRLMLATRDLHDRTERRLNIGGIGTLEAYQGLLMRLLGFYQPMEDALQRIDWGCSSIAISDRLKCTWLKEDLQHLGLAPHSIAQLDMCCDLPSIVSLYEGLGALYVLEGATLGGQVVLRALAPHLKITPMDGGRFYASYGNRVSLMWHSYLDILEKASEQPDLADDIEAGAVQTFRAFDRWFDREHRT